MRKVRFNPALGLFFAGAVASAAAPEDFSAAINANQTGINEYAITEHGESLIAGSPFTPSKLPFTFAPGVPVFPVEAQISTAHHYLYVIYSELSGVPNMLVQYAVHPTGLVENWDVATDFNGGDDLNHVAGLQSMVATGNEIIVYYHYPWGLSAEIFSSSGTVHGKADSDPSGGPVFESLKIDPNENFYYACFLNNGHAYVSIFDMNKGKLLQNSTDPTFIASECD